MARAQQARLLVEGFTFVVVTVDIAVGVIGGDGAAAVVAAAAVTVAVVIPVARVSGDCETTPLRIPSKRLHKPLHP